MCGTMALCMNTYPAQKAFYAILQGADDVACQHFKAASQIYGQLCEREERLSEEEGMELPVLREWRRNMADLDTESQR